MLCDEVPLYLPDQQCQQVLEDSPVSEPSNFWWKLKQNTKSVTPNCTDSDET